MPIQQMSFGGEEKTVFFEGLYPSYGQWYVIKKILYDSSKDNVTGPQGILIFEDEEGEVVLAINDVVQNNTRKDDEAYYHEAAVHCAVNSVGQKPTSALVIGSDGGMLRELVKYQSFREIVAVDIDERVIELVRKFLPSIPDGAWEDPRVTKIIADGADLARSFAEEEREFDVIIVDSPDPIGCATSLFHPKFYQNLARILSRRGVLIRQTGCNVRQPDEMPTNLWQMQRVFKDGDVQVFLTSVASYIGAYFTFVAASHMPGIFRALDKLEERFAAEMSSELRSALRWYSPKMHRAAMELPAGLERMIEEMEWGRELLLDLFECDYEAITSSEKIKEFKARACEVIKMKAYGEPMVTPDFGEGKSRTAGLSSLQWVETSSLVGHYAKHLRIAFQDIFTCAALDAEAAVKFAMEFFGAEEAVWRVVARGRKSSEPEEELTVHKTTRKEDKFPTVTYCYTLNPSRIATRNL